LGFSLGSVIGLIVQKPVQISVTQLAHFACRSGDLMPAGVIGPTARDGIRTHRKIQRQVIEAAELAHSTQRVNDENSVSSPAKAQVIDTGVKAEVSLSCCCVVDSMPVKLTGRIDILDKHKERLIEIKTTLVPAEKLPESQIAQQWAQLYLYGFIYLASTDNAEVSERDQTNELADVSEALDSRLGDIELELLHVNIRADTTTSDVRSVSSDTVSAHATTALTLYVQWLRQITLRREKLKKSAESLPFPHRDFRQGQRDMAAAVFRAARDGQPLLCEAPTGIGKTISALFPASKILSGNDVVQIVYLTAKVAGRLSAVKSLSHLKDAGLQLNAIQIRAKQATCFCSIGRCERDEHGRCPMSLGFFDRLPDARHELLSTGVIDGAQLDEIAWQHQLCPFELALQMLPWMHVVIADYNYVFDPLVRLPHFSESRLDTVLLVDEAHNLVDRSRSMFSAELSRLQCHDEATACRQTHPLVSRSLERLVRALSEHVKEFEEDETVSDSANAHLGRSVGKAVEAMVATMGDTPALSESYSELFRVLCRYVAITELFREHHRCITTLSKIGKRREINVSLFCLDASEALARQYRIFKSTIAFSATLRPVLFYRDTLGLPPETSKLMLSTPFDPERSFHAVVDWIDTRYKQRAHSMSALISLIKVVSDRKCGNYLVFLPSYAYLNLAFEAFTSEYPESVVWKQTAAQSKTEQQNLLEELDVPEHRIGFAILGGVFGEGIDYVGDKLIGVIVISTGLPGLGTQTQLIAEHYRRQGHDGYDFSYRYPGFTRVLQTAGRLIRSESDAGIVVFVDDRFKQPFYHSLYPGEWLIRNPHSELELSSAIGTFWETLPECV